MDDIERSLRAELAEARALAKAERSWFTNPRPTSASGDWEQLSFDFPEKPPAGWQQLELPFDTGVTRGGVQYGPVSPAHRYAELVNSNRPWSWADDFGSTMTRGQRSAIKQDAIARGLVPEVPMKPGTKFADFEAAGLVQHVDELPQDLWKVGDQAQFNWLDARLPNGRPVGTTWHHSDVPGRMELVPFGPHNITSHAGGRSRGMWAEAPR